VAQALETIRQIGSHVGKHVVFGYDRYLLPELDVYTQMLAAYGLPIPAVDSSNLHYLSSAERVCTRVQRRIDHVGVLICSTAMGMSIAANKFRGIYAARCLSVDDAVMSRVINNANVLCLASRSGAESNLDIVTAFMTTPFEGRKLEQLEVIASLGLEAEPLAAPPVHARPRHAAGGASAPVAAVLRSRRD
jgi:ribose 5-phosphate isomerase B